MPLHLPEVVRVEASAGSGKTTKLALRYLDLLLNAGAPPSSVLAVTFTKKATVEMQDRILLYLKELALGHEDDRLGDLAPRPSPERAAAALDLLLGRFHDFRVSTIDSFLTALARATALENALSPAFEVNLDPGAVAGRALLSLLEDYGPGTAGRHPELEEALVSLLQTEEDIGWDLGRVLVERFRALRQAETLRSVPIDAGAAGPDPFALEGRLVRLLEEGVLGPLDAGRVEYRYQGDPLRDFARRGRPLEEVPALFREASGVFKKATLGRVEGWEAVPPLARALLEARARRRLLPSADLHARARGAFKRLQEEGNTLLLDTLQETIRDYVRREGAVPYVYIKLGEALRHYLIDEFQDTSPLQWEIFLPLVENSVAEGGSLFFVGDVKQAIYGWRGGDYTLFGSAGEGLPVPPRTVPLADNWRSGRVVLEFVESVFARGNLERWLSEEFGDDDPVDGGAVMGHFARVAQRPHDDGGFVRVEPCPEAPGPKEAVDRAVLDRLVAGVREARERHPWRDIAVIVRKNALARDALRRLVEEGIPAVSPSALGLLSAPRVREALSLLRWLDDPADDLALAGFLRSPLFLGAAGLDAAAVHALLEERDRRVPLYVAFRDTHPGPWGEFIAPLFRQAGFLPPYDLASRLLAALDAFRRFPGDEAFLCALLELIKDLETEGQNSLGRLLATLREADRNDEDPHPVRMPENLDAVQVLTIHKAKGLEFPVVLLPWAMLDWHPLNDLFLQEGEGLRPYRVRKGLVAQLPPEVGRVYGEARTRALVEELNAFYVACTRARRELVVLLPRYRSESRKKKTPVPYEAVTKGAPGEGRAAEGGPPAPPARPPRRRGEWQERLVRHGVDLRNLADPARREALARGAERHRAMERARRFEELDPLVRGRIGAPAGEIALRREQEIVGPDGRTHRVDLLVVTGERVWVVDYKTGGGDPGKDRAQVLRYLELARPLFPGRVLAGLLAYLDRDAVEEVP
jgi:ATP-dependent exoDNAse (exonuclease V) beta subunit